MGRFEACGRRKSILHGQHCGRTWSEDGGSNQVGQLGLTDARGASECMGGKVERWNGRMWWSSSGSPWQLAHMILEAEKSHVLPSASWRTSKTWFLSDSKGLGNRNTDVWWRERVDALAQTEAKFTLLLFPSSQALHGLHKASHLHYRRWLSLRILISSRNTLTDTPINAVSSAIRASLSLGKLTHKINHQGKWRPEFIVLFNIQIHMDVIYHSES